MEDFLLNLWAIIQIILGFTFLIFIHELGHFLMAKKVGVRATQFAIGFGQALVSYRPGLGWRMGTTEPELQKLVLERAQAEGRELPEKLTETDIHTLADEYGYGETEYRFNWMPLGGYVKMVGQEDLDPAASSNDPRSFTRASFWGRMGIISAGVIMNAILAVILFIIAFSIGVDFPPAIVGDVLPNGPGAQAVAQEDDSVVGLRTGDRVLSVDGDPTSDFTSILIAAPLGDEGVPITFVVDRPQLDGSDPRRLTFKVTPRPAEPKKQRPLPYIDVGMPWSLQILQEDELSDDGRKIQEGFGLEPGMSIVAVDGRPITEYWELDQLVDACGGEPVKLTFASESGTTKDVVFEVDPELAPVAFTAKGDDESEDLPQLLGLVPPVKVTMIQGGAAAEGKVEKGDVIVAANDVRWPTIRALQNVVNASGKKGEAVKVELLRDGKMVSAEITPKEGDDDRYLIGVGLSYEVESNRVARVLEGSPLRNVGIVPGSIMQTVAGSEVADYADMFRAMRKVEGDSFEVAFTLPPDHKAGPSFNVDVPADFADQLAAVGWMLPGDVPQLRQLRVMQKADGIVEAAQMGFEKTHLIMVQTYLTLLKTINGWIPVENLHGPVGIVAQGKNVTKRGFAYLMFFLGLISINLAVINFLPMPIVDGGLAVLLIVEKLRGRPLPANVAGAINLVGLLLIATLFITLTYHDIARIVTGS